MLTKGVSFGFVTANPDGTLDLSQLQGVDKDLAIRPFSWKGVIPSLRQFTVNALNVHSGMQADERFGAAMTGEADFDGDGLSDEVSPGVVSALVAFQAALPAPTERPFDNADWQQHATKGRALFDQIGCNTCHIAALAAA